MTLFQEIRDTIAEWGCDCEPSTSICPQCAASENLHVLEREREAYRRALTWIGREATKEDFERRWSTVQDVACIALTGVAMIPEKASPDLLEALRDVVEVATMAGVTGEAMNAARLALAKAVQP